MSEIFMDLLERRASLLLLRKKITTSISYRLLRWNYRKVDWIDRELTSLELEVGLIRNNLIHTQIIVSEELS